MTEYSNTVFGTLDTAAPVRSSFHFTPSMQKPYGRFLRPTASFFMPYLNVIPANNQKNINIYMLVMYSDSVK